MLLLHGFEHHRPRGHWLWWLAEELRRARVPVQYPQLPSPELPRLEAWREVALGELAMLGDGERVVITHSLGGILWLHVAQGLDPSLRVDRVLMTAPPHPDRLTGPMGDLALGTVDVAAVARASGSTMVAARAEDPYRAGPIGALATRWGLPSVEIAGVGHLNPDDGHGPWGAALEWVLADDRDLEWRPGEHAD